MIVAPIRCPERSRESSKLGRAAPWLSTVTARRRSRSWPTLAGVLQDWDEASRKRSAPTFMAVAAQRMTSFGREALQRAKECSRFNAGQNKQRTRGVCAFADEDSRSGEFFPGCCCQPCWGLHGTAARKREVAAFHLENTRTPFKPCDAGRRSDRRTGGSAASAQPVPQLAHKRSRPGA